ncbi:MAG: RNA-binding S4 domain-containing protein [Asticcacaulis sp.]
MQAEISSCRADVWLWRARFFKTRALALKACEGGHIRIERFGKMVRLEKAATLLRSGDHLVFALGTRLMDIRVQAVGERRGPAPEAQTLYCVVASPL